MTGKKIDLNSFKTCLEALDYKLRQVNEEIELKAIGGFALLYHEVRKSGYTQDIDTVTRDFSNMVSNLITEVALQFGVGEDWLNNNNVFDNDVESIEYMLEPFWEKIEWGLTNISLYVADLETLLRAKLLAAEDDNLTGRVQDFPDLLDIFAKLGCHELVSCVNRCDDIGVSLDKDYPRTLRRLTAIFANLHKS